MLGLPPHDEFDHLGALPRNIRVEILSQLGLPDVRIDKCGNIVTAGHALSNLALVSKGRRDQVEAFWRPFLACVEACSRGSA